MPTRRSMLAAMLGSCTHLFAAGAHAATRRYLDADYSFVLYYTHTGLSGSRGSAMFSGRTDAGVHTIEADVQFPFSVQRLASIIPLPCPSIRKRYRYEDGGDRTVYTNENGTFHLDNGRTNLFEVAEQSILDIRSSPLECALEPTVHRDVFITCDDRKSKRDETIDNLDGKTFARVIRDIEITCHGVHEVMGERYLLVRAAPTNGLIPVLDTRLLKVGLVDVTGFIRQDGACDWITLRIDNYLDVSGVAESMVEREEREEAFMTVYREVLDNC